MAQHCIRDFPFRPPVAATARSAALVAMIASAMVAAPAQATPGSGFKAEQQWKGVYDDMDVKAESDSLELELKTKGTTNLFVVRNAIAIGGHSGWHTHPGPSLITVTVGEIMVYDSDNPLCTPTLYRAGEGFVDAGGEHVHLLRNESGAPAETVAVQFLPTGGERRIDARKPNNCNF